MALWAPQPGPQLAAIEADWCPELFYGGAAGGGKSDYLLGDWLQDVPRYGQAWQGVLFRRTYPELEELLKRSVEIYPQTGAEWKAQDRTWIWPNGAMLRLRYLERDMDATRYQGHQYTWIGWDELTQWPTDYAYRFLRARLRSAHHVPTKRIRAAANPGGVGHLWVKSAFIDPHPMGSVPFVDTETGMERLFIRAKLADNRILLSSDAAYADRLKGLGSEALVRAWLEGDWDVVEGAFFDNWSVSRHVVRPVELPSYWTRFRSFDWGSFRPFSHGWWAVSDGELPQFPKGALIRYREWYGMKKGQPNVGIKLESDAIAKGIKEREAIGERIHYGVADPAIFKAEDGESIAEKMARNGVTFNRGDNSRVTGWAQIRDRLEGEDGRPMLYVFSTCADFIRTLPALQHDTHRPEDVDTDGEDHAADEARYACMSRPYARSKAQEPKRPARYAKRPAKGSGAWAA